MADEKTWKKWQGQGVPPGKGGMSKSDNQEADEGEAGRWPWSPASCVVQPVQSITTLNGTRAGSVAARPPPWFR